MTLKAWFAWKTLVLSYLAVCRSSQAGVITLEQEPHHQNDLHHQDDHHVSVASSFMHFHGPVEGPEFEVKVPYIIHHTSEHNHLHDDEGAGQGHEAAGTEGEHHGFHQGYTLDYVAHPKYQFSYGVEDHHTGDFHGQKETRDGSSVSGEYSVKEPGGGVRVVTYRADKDGFHAVVHTSGKNDHSGATYSADAHHEHSASHHHHHPHVHQELQVQDQGYQVESTGGHELREYAAGYGIHEGYN